MVASEVEIQRTVAGRSFARTVTGERCGACGWELVQGTDLEAFELEVARELLAGPASAEALRWVRAAHGLTRPALGALLGVGEERVKGWESGEEAVDVGTWHKVKKVLDLV